MRIVSSTPNGMAHRQKASGALNVSWVKRLCTSASGFGTPLKKVLSRTTVVPVEADFDQA